MEPATHEYGLRAAGPATARTGLVVFVAVLTELVIIAAADNQWVSSQLVKAQERTDRVGLRMLEGSWLTYTWRVTPRTGLGDTWWSELALILTVLVVTGLLVLAAVRGPVTFGRAFFATWTAVIVASLLGAFVRGLIDPASTTALPGTSRVTRAAFGGPTAGVAIAGLGLGFVVALLTAAVAATTRRSPAREREPEQTYDSPFFDPEPPPPFYGTPAGPNQPSGVRPWQDQHYGPPRRSVAPAGPSRSEEAQQTTRLPPAQPLRYEWPQRGPDRPAAQGDRPTTRVEPTGEGDRPPTQMPAPPHEGDRPTTQMPEPAAEGDHPTTQIPEPAAEGDHPTTQFPRPPDDDAIGP